jgi:hypothetical protein
MMKYRDIEYAVVQGVGRHMWKWSASVADVVITGQAYSKLAAVVDAEKAIDRALALKKVRLTGRDAVVGCDERQGDVVSHLGHQSFSLRSHGGPCRPRA